MIYKFNNYELNTQLYRLSNGESAVDIEPQVFDLLNYLIENRERLVSRKELFDTIWSGRVVSDTTLSNHIKSARRAIGDDGQNQACIRTIHGRGYQFIAETNQTVNHRSDLTNFPITDKVSIESLGPFVAVLPFQNMSPDQEQNFFAEGISEDITTELSRFKDIQVIARHSAFQYNHTRLDIKKVCEDLGVNYLVEGSVQRAADSIRVNVQLIEAKTGKHVWAEKYDRPIDQVFSIQDEITETVVSTVTGQIRKIETDRSIARGTDSLSAYDHFLRGISFHRNGYAGYDDEIRATEAFNKAIELDPNFARARAWVECSKASVWGEGKSDEKIYTAIENGKIALSLDENESETHRILGSLYLYLRKFQLAGYHFSKAKQLSPNDAHITVKLAQYYAFTDQLDEAMKTVERAMRLNPLHPGWYWLEKGVVYYSVGDYPEAINSFYKNSEMGHYDLAWIGASHIAQGSIDLAKQAASKAIDIEPKASVYTYTKFETYQDRSKHKLLCDRMIAAGIPP